MSAFWDHARCEVAIDKVLEVVSGDPVSLRWAQAFGPDCGKKGEILMVEVVFPPVTRRARNKNKSEMNRCLPIWLSRPTSHQPSHRAPGGVGGCRLVSPACFGGGLWARLLRVLGSLPLILGSEG